MYTINIDSAKDNGNGQWTLKIKSKIDPGAA
jgi:hypothetical protein